MGSDDGWDGQAELQALRAQVEGLRGYISACWTCDQKGRAEQAEAEVERLKADQQACLECHGGLQERALHAEARCRELEPVRDTRRDDVGAAPSFHRWLTPGLTGTKERSE